MVLRNPAGNVQRLTLIYAVAMLAFSCLTSVLALYLSAEFGITEKTIGYVFLYVGIFSVLMRSALIGPIVDRIGEPWSIRAGAATLILGLLAYPLAPNLWSLAFIVPLVPIGTSLLFPATTALMSHHSPRWSWEPRWELPRPLRAFLASWRHWFPQRFSRGSAMACLFTLQQPSSEW